MKKIVVFTVISCLLATSMAFAGTKKKKKKTTKDTESKMVFLFLLAQKRLAHADFLLSLTGLTLKVITIFFLY